MKFLKFLTFGVLCIAFVSACTGKDVKSKVPDVQTEEAQTEDIIETESQQKAPEKFTTTSVGVSLDEDDRELISWLIACEVGDRPFTAQVCLASVILNRIMDAGFSESARGVIFESGDFKSVSRGEVSGGVTEAEKSTKKYKVAEAALDEAMKGDPTNGALYFGYVGEDKVSHIGFYECGGMVFGR